jgi:hypothetical protein
MHKYIHKYVRTYIHTYIRTYIRTYVHTYIHTHIHKYMHKYIHKYVRTYIHTYIRTYIHTYTHIYTHTHIHTYNLCRPIFVQHTCTDTQSTHTRLHMNVEAGWDFSPLHLTAMNAVRNSFPLYSQCLQDVVYLYIPVQQHVMEIRAAESRGCEGSRFSRVLRGNAAEFGMSWERKVIHHPRQLP